MTRSCCSAWGVSFIVMGLLAAGCSSGTPSKSDGNKKETAGDGNTADVQESGMDVQTEPIELGGIDGVTQYFLSNDRGMTVTLINYGAIITSVVVPDKDGAATNVTLGFADLPGYLKNAPYFGSLCGRYANRIAGGKFRLDGKDYALAVNNPPNHLHGGLQGFNHVLWHGRVIPRGESDGGDAVGEEGYPGNLVITVRYTLTNANELKIHYTAQTDKPTPINLTSHCYWNLAGDGNILSHELTLNCAKFLPVDSALIPTGKQQPVAGTSMDFTKPATIGSRIDQVSGGYDHCYVIDGWDKSLRLAAIVREPKSGRVMQVLTTEPGVQFYTGNFLDGTSQSGGFKKQEGFALECQHFPDSPNHPSFPTTILKPGEAYEQMTVYRFSAK